MIRVFNNNIIPLAEIDSFKSFLFERDFYSIGNFELHLILNENYINFFKKDYLIMFENDHKKIGIIKNIEIEKDENEVETLIVTGPTLKSLISKRVILPPKDKKFDEQVGYQEDIMKNFVINNFIDTSDERIIENLIVAPSKSLGKKDMWRSRFENVAIKLEEISRYSQLGWDIHLNIKEKQYIFDIVQGKDLTDSVVFSRNFDNVSNEIFINFNEDVKNVIYAENNNELIQSYGEQTGINRNEVYENFNTNDLSELRLEALRKLESYKPIVSLDSEYRHSNSFIYKEDFDLGDYITFINRKWGVRLETQIVKIIESIESGQKYIDIEFGNNIPSKIKGGII